MAEIDVQTTAALNGFDDSDEPSGRLSNKHVEEYLSQLLTATLGASQAELEIEGSLLSTISLPDTLRRCGHFLHSNQTSLYAHKYVVSDEGYNGEDARPSIVCPRPTKTVPLIK